ncbi:MAG: TIGR02391 family protein [Pseudonocardiaceae bacterium]
MIFFTTYVTIIRRSQEAAEKRRGSPAQVEGNTIRLPLGTDVQAGDYLEHRLANDEPRMMTAIDIIHPHMPGAGNVDDYIEVTCVPTARAAIRQVMAPALHPTLSVAIALAEEGRMSEAVFDAFRLVEERVRSLTVSDDSGRALMESVFGAKPPQLDITTTTGQAVHDEREGFRLLFIGAVLALGGHQGAGRAVPAALDETLEYLAVASMLMRRLDSAEGRLS